MPLKKPDNGINNVGKESRKSEDDYDRPRQVDDGKCDHEAKDRQKNARGAAIKRMSYVSAAESAAFGLLSLSFHLLLQCPQRTLKRRPGLADRRLPYNASFESCESCLL
jgi:hypothetical protein